MTISSVDIVWTTGGPNIDAVFMQHRVDDPVYETAGDGQGFRVECSCGWRSPWCANNTHAIAAGEQHTQLAASGPSRQATTN